MSFEALIHVVQNRALTVVARAHADEQPHTLAQAWRALHDA